MPDFDPNVSPYIAKHPIRKLCVKCRERPAAPNLSLCEVCVKHVVTTAQIIDSDEMQAHRIYRGERG